MVRGQRKRNSSSTDYQVSSGCATHERALAPYQARFHCIHCQCLRARPMPPLSAYRMNWFIVGPTKEQKIRNSLSPKSSDRELG